MRSETTSHSSIRIHRVSAVLGLVFATTAALAGCGLEQSARFGGSSNTPNADDDGGWNVQNDADSPDGFDDPDVGPDVSKETCDQQRLVPDGECNPTTCDFVDPDCGGEPCPDPRDPDVSYVGGSASNPEVCTRIKFSCPDGESAFSNARCGCGCIKNQQTCPDENDPEVRYISKSPEVCKSVRISCKAGRVPFSNDCGCGCKPGEPGKPTCDGQDATAVGQCRMIIGVKFDGDKCVTMGGCRCEGSECNQLFGSKDACKKAYSHCTSSNCGAQDIRGDGACAKFLGYAFDGVSCTGISGCQCKGSDCGEIYRSRSACQNDFQQCIGGSEDCGGWARPCDPNEYCDYPNNSCGATDQSGTCKPSPRGCPEHYAPVCGCDGQTYGNTCKAHAAGVDIVASGACE